MKARYTKRNEIFCGKVKYNDIFEVLQISNDICFIKVGNDVIGISSKYIKLIKDGDTHSKKFYILNDYKEVVSKCGIIWNKTYFKSLDGCIYNRIEHKGLRNDKI